MRLAWWGFVVIGLALIGVGVFTASTSQSTMNYCHSLIKTMACGASLQSSAQPKFFLSEASAVSLQEAEFAWVVGLVVVALGLISAAYGTFSKVWPDQTPLATT